MTEVHQAPAAPAQQTSKTTETPASSRLGNPASEVRALLPVLACAVVLVAGTLVMVILPVARTVAAEPSPVIRAVLADFAMLLNLRLWPVLLAGLMVAAVLAVMGARKVARANYRLEKRLRKLASGEYDDTPFSRDVEFPQFEEVVLTLAYAQEQARKKGRSTLLQAEGTIDKLMRRLINEDVPRVEIQKALAGIHTELNNLLEASRPAGSGKPKQ
jgi:hypothetical protein